MAGRGLVQGIIPWVEKMVHVVELGEVGRWKPESESGGNGTVERRLGFFLLASPGGGCLQELFVPLWGVLSEADFRQMKEGLTCGNS